ncbi:MULTISPECIES: 1,2-phenylacetyl-CoA epoxidase subunit PaaC [unclassified Pseudomonas]|uniref:1,2-phenylacetyl-CoA epoxidase subunit PaaC n=1 Tax=unclassified Pseudomonas TaxID=196821 RepID=UPI0002A227B7|nr:MULTISPECIES: 1,2-phenylacetyl-CoA epoxidase subunit PaaC [unclassified Pseudomonas]MBB1609766.1 phenylacetate-CoA oxygenase subunit PaaI [Pseudomonas sp. UMC76]MBB1638764.1 phenylacetate-CoA oxygenase subunit PaaI [Pseudomonas sp. UME83]NTX90290.1 phenylacetate-CoA oxygenase subunit PaaC [Pseudomonas sp. UMA643]NTY19497.1 phenylacetate-CoA oxygenase subunit PaaC [Pseudomonas sp. UMC3103]NTY27759.1 phenylacetate-CoA oxygenase subunit PaaC [Pseudomonas sp. UMA603]
MNPHNDKIEYLLRLADSALIQGQRLCEWCGRAPALEEELALMNVGLDLVGQARNWYEYAAELLDDGRDADHLAFRRDERAFRNLLLVEQPNGDFAVTMAKQFLYDAWHFHVLRQLSNSSDARIAAIAAKGLKEVTYHLRRSGEWVERLGDGTEESHARMLAAIPQVWRFTVEMTNADEVEQRLFAEGVTPNPEELAAAWRAKVADIFASATLPLPEPAVNFYLSGRRGLHTEHLGILLAEMQFLQRAYPDATW